jgi:hypothetical protein
MTSLLTRRRRTRRRAFIEGYAFPMALRNKLREELDGDRPVNVALEGLREWYLACLDAGPDAMLGMPSRAVDVAWHEMILMTREYSGFCERAFGRYRHHSPASTLSIPMQEMLTETLAVVDKHRLPMRLFTADAETAIPGGYAWDESELRRMRDVIEQRRRERWGGDGGGDGDGGGCGGCG